MRAKGLPEDAKGLLDAQGEGLLRRAAGRARPASRRPRSRGRRRSLGVTAGVQAHRHLRRRVRIAHALPLFLLRGRRRAAGASARPSRPTGSKVIILGGGPNRIGQGIEFDYCCVHAVFALREAGFETIMVNCNPGDRLDRLRHLRPALFRAADGRGRDRAGRGRAPQRRAAGRDRAVRRPDAAQAGQAARGGGHSDPRHLARRDRPRRGPRALPEAARTSWACASPTTASRDVAGRGDRGRREDRLPGGDPAVLRAGRPRHADRLRRDAAASATCATR